jgi:hypothetical protein
MQEVRGGALQAHQDLGGRGVAAPLPGQQRSSLPVFFARVLASSKAMHGYP